MASLAGMLKERGYEVRGSDQNVYPPMSTELERLGIEVYSGYSDCNLDWRPELVVIGNALSRGNPEVERVLNDSIRYASMPEVIRECFLRGKKSVVVSGTHGKTTTTSMLAWIFECAGLKPSFLIGGMAQNFAHSFQLSEGAHFIIEGDEYDTAFFDKGPKFLHYLPHSVLINNIEFDHADIYADLEAVKLSFRRLINIIPGNGHLIANANDAVVSEMTPAAFCKVVPFGITSNSKSEQPHRSCDGAFFADDIAASHEGTSFTVCQGEMTFGRFTLPLFGEFNVSNAVGAIAMAAQEGIDADAIGSALLSFKSVRRRMEVRGTVNGITVIDDFAHHPTAIQRTLEGIRSQFPGSRLWAIVEPRSATMRRAIVAGDLANALMAADEVIVADVYAPGKIPEAQRLSPQQVAASLADRGKSARFMATANEIVSRCAPRLLTGDVVAIFSNGGFDGIHEKFLEALKKEAVKA